MASLLHVVYQTYGVAYRSKQTFHGRRLMKYYANLFRLSGAL